MGGYIVAEALRAGRQTGRLATESGVLRRLSAWATMAVSALWRRVTSGHVRIGCGLKIRVSAVRFRPWPSSKKTSTYVAPSRPHGDVTLGDSLGDPSFWGRSSSAMVSSVWRIIG